MGRRAWVVGLLWAWACGAPTPPWEEDHFSEARSEVSGSGPTAIFTGGPTSGRAPLAVSLDGSRSTPAADGTWLAACRVDFGDGTSTNNCWGAHSYAAGEWTATFTATDNLGRSARAQLVISASGPNVDAGTSRDGGAPADAGTRDAGAASDGGRRDAGTVDGGPGDAGAADAGSGDGGTVDAGAALDGGALLWFSSAQGMPWARGVSADEAGTVWAVNDTGIYSRRANASAFTSHAAVGQLTRGDWPYTICGGAPNQAYVGYVSPESIPPFGGTPEQRLRGDLDRVALGADGRVALEHHYQIVNSNDARYDEVRTIVSCVRQNDRSLPNFGDLFLGSNHAVTRVRGDAYADHRHAVFADANGSLVIGYNWATALEPNGDLFFANEYKLGIIRSTRSLTDWLSFTVNPWVLDTYASVLGPVEDPDRWHAAAVTPDGRHWLGSQGKGLLWMTPSPRRYQVISNAPDTQVNALAAEADNSVWVATQNAGLWRLSANGTWSSLALPSRRVLGLFLDKRTTPRTLHIATDKGVGLYRGP